MRSLISRVNSGKMDYLSIKCTIDNINRLNLGILPVLYRSGN